MLIVPNDIKINLKNLKKIENIDMENLLHRGKPSNVKTWERRIKKYSWMQMVKVKGYKND